MALPPQKKRDAVKQTSSEQLELSQQARNASLLKIWAADRRQLTPPELAEIKHLLPVESPPPPASSPLVPPHLSRGKKTKYAQKLIEYEAVYCKKVRAIKEWISTGKSQTPWDLPPLDDPAKMPEWWVRRMQQRVPDGINIAAANARDAAGPPQPPENPPPSAGVAAGSSPPGDSGVRDFSNLETLDLRGAVQQLRKSLAITHRLHHEALIGQESNGVPDEGLIRARQNAYTDVFDLLRKAENDLVKWERERGGLIARDEVRGENNRIASAIYNAVMRLIKNLRPQLAGKTPGEQDQLWERESLACFASLKSAKFTSPVTASVPLPTASGAA